MPYCVSVVGQLLKMHLFLDTEKESMVDMELRSLAVPFILIRGRFGYI